MAKQMYSFQEVRELLEKFKTIAPLDIDILMYQVDGRIGKGLNIKIIQRGKYHSSYTNIEYDLAAEILSMLIGIYS